MSELGPRSVPLTQPSVGPEELAAVAAVLDSGWLAGQGPQSKALEAAFSELTGRQHAIAVNNCTAGLHLALLALGVGLGDEVLVADYTFPATGHAVRYCGATPVFVDVKADTATLDPADAKAAITERTRGIIAVDALGVPADYAELTALADANNLFLISDSACSAGGTYHSQPCGSFGDVAVFSLHARKGITCGEGGVVVTDDAQLADAIRTRSCFGMTSAFDRQGFANLAIPQFTDLGYNYKLSDILAAIAVVQVGKLPALQRQRHEHAAYYHEQLRDLTQLILPQVPNDRTATWQTFAVTLREPHQRDRVVTELRNRGIGSNIGTYALHQQPVYEQARACPQSAATFAAHVALPMYPELTTADQDGVITALREVL